MSLRRAGVVRAMAGISIDCAWFPRRIINRPDG